MNQSFGGSDEETGAPTAPSTGAHRALTEMEWCFSYAAIALQCQKLAGDLADLAAELMQSSEKSAMPSTARSLVQWTIRNRRLRSRFLDDQLFADPAWDMLLDLYLAEIDERRISVSSLCIASAVPQTTALRWIETLVEAGLVTRERCPADGRVSYVQLTPAASAKMRDYIAYITSGAGD